MLVDTQDAPSADLGTPDAAQPEADERAELAAFYAHLAMERMKENRPTGAEAFSRAALRADPDLFAAHLLLSAALDTQGRHGESLEVVRECARRWPDEPAARDTLVFAHLALGRYREAWGCVPEDGHRDHLMDMEGQDLRGPKWSGDPAALPGKVLLLLCCAGAGDTFQLIRFAPVLAAHGARVIVVCLRHLMPVVARVAGVAAVADVDEPLPAYDLWAGDWGVVRRLAVTLGTIPHVEGYITPDPARVRRWRNLLPPGRKVGIVWAGSAENRSDGCRSIPQAELADTWRPTLDVPGVSFVSLQVGPRSGEAVALPGVLDVSALLTDYAETAALIANLDLVIGVETSATHLAGAMGVPAWLMLSRLTCWRWLREGETSPWYASARLFRQRRFGDWQGVGATVAAALAQSARGARG